MNLSELSKQVSYCIFCDAPLVLEEGSFEDHEDPYCCPNESSHPNTLIWAWVNTNTPENIVVCLNIKVGNKQLQISFEENCTYAFPVGHGGKFDRNKIPNCHIPNLNKNTIENKIVTMMIFS